MKLLLEDAIEAVNGVWLTFAAPHQLSMVGQAKTTRGTTSVLLASSPVYDRDRSQLLVDADHIVVLNLGTTPRTVVVDTIFSAETVEAREAKQLGKSELGPGDREFFGLAEAELQGEAQKAAIDLIREVRRNWPGDLIRGQRNNFSNTPDNFWYVIVQPRAQALSITVRGTPKHLHSSVLELKMDRPGYTRFTVKTPEDVPEAIRLIEQSKRKGTRQ
jgi:hypothetical protein